jgi:hypothetical protein
VDTSSIQGRPHSACVPPDPFHDSDAVRTDKLLASERVR